MKIAILTNEYPPYVYGGAGVHVEYLSRELSRLPGEAHEVHVLSFGDQSVKTPFLSVQGIELPFGIDFPDSRQQKLGDTLLRNVVMSARLEKADIIHCHTWYTHLAGCLLKQLLDVPLVLTTHSLEPHRPWKEEQLGPAYSVSAWVEKTAYENADGVIAVSKAMKRDVHTLYGVPADKIEVIHNGIDLAQYQPTPDRSILAARGIDADTPFLLFVGRITRQKGISHLLRAVPLLGSGVQVVLCAGAPDTEEYGREITQLIESVRKETENKIIWIPEVLSREEIIPLYTLATLFICPSIYEPFGIINLEAMACGTPVVASAVGGITEVVVHGETGLLVPFEARDSTTSEPRDPVQFSRDLASAANSLLGSPERIERMGTLARKRVEDLFSWQSIARRTMAFYKSLIKGAEPALN